MSVLLRLTLVSLAGSSTFAAGPRIAFVLAEHEYDTERTVTAFFESELKPLGFTASYVTAPGEGDGRNDLKRVEKALAKADLLFVSVRRRAPKVSQMKAIRAWVKAAAIPLSLKLPEGFIPSYCK